jgi:hypothetical protein
MVAPNASPLVQIDAPRMPVVSMVTRRGEFSMKPSRNILKRISIDSPFLRLNREIKEGGNQ